jgi:hypothetical protein
MENKYLIEVKAPGPIAINLHHISGVIQLWIYACTFAFIVFMVEIFWHKGQLIIDKIYNS